VAADDALVDDADLVPRMTDVSCSALGELRRFVGSVVEPNRAVDSRNDGEIRARPVRGITRLQR